jgi:RNA polymerase sigma-70 factor (ECF subfamily)
MSIPEYLPDNEIVKLFYARDERALSETARKYGALFRSVANNLLQSVPDAEECENDAYLRLWNAIPPAEPKDLGAYGVKIARNLALDAVKKRTAQKRGGCAAIEELCADFDDFPDTSADGRELGELLDEFLRAQDKRDRVMFVLRYFYGEPLKETAERCGISESSVKTRLFRTRKKLRSFLQKKGVTV